MQTKPSTANNFPPKSMQQISLETRRRSNCKCKPDRIFSEFSYDLSAVTAPLPPRHALPTQIRVRNPLSIASPIIQLVSITFHSILLRFRFGHSSMKSIYEMNFASHKILYITNQPAKDCRAGWERESWVPKIWISIKLNFSSTSSAWDMTTSSAVNHTVYADIMQYIKIILRACVCVLVCVCVTAAWATCRMRDASSITHTPCYIFIYINIYL